MRYLYAFFTLLLTAAAQGESTRGSLPYVDSEDTTGWTCRVSTIKHSAGLLDALKLRFSYVSTQRPFPRSECFVGLMWSTQWPTRKTASTDHPVDELCVEE